MNSAPVGRFLRGTGRKLLLVRTARAMGLAAAGAAAIILVSVVLDAVFGFAPVVLVALDAIIVGAVVAGIAAVFMQPLRSRFDARRLAVLAERGLGIGDNALINAVELATPAGGVSASLADMAVRSGEEAISGRRAGRAIDPGPALRALGMGMVAAICLLAAWAVFPRVFAAVVPRLLSPHADHPPFTLLRFDIRTDPGRVVYGRPAQVLVGLKGPALPDTADIVFDDGPGTPRTRTAMMRGAESFIFRLDRAQESRRFCIDTAQGRSPWKQLTVHPVPSVERVTMRLDYPSYTSWPSDEFELGPRPISVLEGTRVTVSLKSTLPLRSVELSLSPEGAEPGSVGSLRVDLSPRPDDPTTAQGEFTLTFGGPCRMDLVGADGTRGDEPAEARFFVVPDAKPRVFITDPGPTSIAPEGWKVDVSVSARDDVGVPKVTMHSGLNRLEPQQSDLTMDHPGAPYTTATHRFDLEAMGAKAGDTIWYYASAFDAKPGAGRFTDTEPHTIQIVTMDEYKELARQQYGIEEMTQELAEFLEEMDRLARERRQLTEEAMKAAAEAQQAAAAGTELSPEQREKMRELADHLARNARQSQDLAKALQERADAPQLYDFEQAYQDMLREQAGAQTQMTDAAARTAEALNQAAGASPSPTPEQARQLQDAARQLAESQQQGNQGQEQAEQTQEEMERLQKAGEMAAQAARLTEIIQRQRQIAEQLGQFRDAETLSPDDQQRASRLAQEQTQLKDDLADTTAQLQKLAEAAKDTLPKMSESAMGICEAIAEMEVPADQQQAAAKAQAGEGPPAHQAADAAADKLESLQGQCQGMCENPSEDLDGALNLSQSQLQQAMKQMAGRRPGMGSGQGQGSGSGAGGSQSRVSLLGPHGGGDRVARALRGGGRKDAPPKPVVPGELGHPGRYERLDPGSAASGRGRGTILQGVPARYREEAEMYFRRLSEDADRAGGGR